MDSVTHNDTAVHLSLEQVEFLSLKLSATELDRWVPGPWILSPWIPIPQVPGVYSLPL